MFNQYKRNKLARKIITIRKMRDEYIDRENSYLFDGDRNVELLWGALYNLMPSCYVKEGTLFLVHPPTGTILFYRWWKHESIIKVINKYCQLLINYHRYSTDVR